MSDKPQGQSFANLPRSKKTAVILLSTVAASILVIWFWQFNIRINKPFNPDPDQQAVIASQKAAATASEQTRDTDHDGLSDYDEINIYHTSPFIEDTDGDGISDGQEVKNGTDPLCPEGTNCGVTNLAAPIATSTIDISQTNNQATSTIDQTLLLQALSGAGDPASLRALLIQNGADQTTLNNISDADLMTSYDEVLKSQTSSTLETAQPVATSTVSQ